MNTHVTPATKRTSKMDVIDRFDTTTDTLPNGEERCDFGWKDVDCSFPEYAVAVWVRCTRPATLHILVTPATSDRVYEAKSCRECYEDALRTQGTCGHVAKVEALPATGCGK